MVAQTFESHSSPMKAPQRHSAASTEPPRNVGYPALLKWRARSRRLPGTVMPHGRPNSNCPTE